MCDHLNEQQIHPSELRVRELEKLLREAVAVLTAKLRPDEWCALEGWLEEISEVLYGD